MTVHVFPVSSEMDILAVILMNVILVIMNVIKMLPVKTPTAAINARVVMVSWVTALVVSMLMNVSMDLTSAVRMHAV